MMIPGPSFLLFIPLSLPPFSLNRKIVDYVDYSITIESQVMMVILLSPYYTCA